MDIIIIEDETVLLELMTDELNHMGFKVKGYSEPFEFLKEMEKGQTLDFNQCVVMSDHNMPGISGTELLKRVVSFKGQRPLATVLLTGGVSRDQENLALEAGIDKIVEKPLDFDHFGQWLKSLR